MPAVIAETLEIVQEKSRTPVHQLSVDDVVIGIFFTGVKFSNGQAGVSVTPIGEIPEAVCCPTSAARMPQAGSVEETPVSEVLRFALDSNVLKSAVGVATLNALSQSIFESGDGTEYKMVRGIDGFDLLDIQPHETVSLVGAFGPYIRRLKLMGNPFFIIEKNPKPLRLDEMKFFRPESEMASALKMSDAVIITGTTIVNHTVDAILSVIPSGARTALIGPTVSMIPDAFFERGVHVMAGVRLLDPDLMLTILKQAGSAYHLLKECSEKIAFVNR